MVSIFHRRPRIGDRAEIIVGPFAGRTGRITSIAGDPPRYEIWLDDCCHPSVQLADLALRRTGFFDRIALADDKRSHSAAGGYSRSPDVALPVALADLLGSHGGDDRASSVWREMQERDRARHE